MFNKEDRVGYKNQSFDDNSYYVVSSDENETVICPVDSHVKVKTEDLMLENEIKGKVFSLHVTSATLGAKGSKIK